MSKSSLKSFVEDVSKELKNSNYYDVYDEGLEKTPIIKGKQCLYIVDWKTKSIKFSKGVQDMLGYADEDFNLNLVIIIFTQKT